MINPPLRDPGRLDVLTTAASGHPQVYSRAMASVHEGLLIDVGGVLTTDVIAGFDEFCAREGLSGISIRDLYYNSTEAQRLFHRLEVGEVDALRCSHSWRA